jgi:hypothetical protein
LIHRKKAAEALAVADALQPWDKENFDDAAKGAIYAVDMHDSPDVVMTTHGIALAKVTSTYEQRYA